LVPVAAAAEEDDWEEIKPTKAKKQAAKKQAAVIAPVPVPAVMAEVVAAPSAGMPPPVPKAKKVKKPKEATPAGGGSAAPEAAAVAAAVAAVAQVEDEWTTVPTRKGSRSKGLNTLDGGISGLEAALADAAEGAGGSEEEPAFMMELGDCLGTVIGKGGSNIRAITEQSGARLDIEKGATLCKISGGADAIRRAALLVQQVLDRRADELANLHTVVLPVGSKAPAVLGKGGCIIRKITADTGARMDVSCEAGTVTVMGTEEQVDALTVSRTVSRTHCVSPTVSRTASLTVSRTVSRTASLTVSRTVSLPLYLAPPHSPSLALSLSHCISHPLSLSHCISHRLPHRLSHCVSPTVSRTASLTVSLTVQVAAAVAAVKTVLHGEAQERIELGGRGVFVIKVRLTHT
jgi:hypothetical protein